MRFTFGAKGLKDEKKGIVAVALHEGHDEKPPALEGLAAEADRLAGGALRRAFEDGSFKGSKGEVHTVQGWGATTLLLVGLGKADKADLEALRVASAAAIKKANRLKDERMVCALHDVALAGGVAVEDRSEAVGVGLVLGSYRFDRFRSKQGEAKDEKDPHPVKTVQFLARNGDELKAVKEGAPRGQVLGEAQVVARDFANTPANVATPTYLAEGARKLAKEHGLKVTVLGPAEMKRHKMGGLLGVAAGSDEPPRMVVLEHRAKRSQGRPYKTVAIVGKGITFDSGGISIKPGQGMELMKYDKAGACAVLGAMTAVARLGLPLNVIGVVAFTENLPSGKAYKPGDILTMASGKTVEVLNTDAEGRLILADALWYAQRSKPDAIIDLATLTGAVEVALGKHYTGIMGSDDALVDMLIKAGETSGERLWRLPLGEGYQDQIKGSHADLNNIGGRGGGSCTAGQFLRNFVEEDKSAWAHLDIAATAWVESDAPYTPKGCTGVGVRVVNTFLRRLVE